jgi:hypothetical protein
MLDTDFEEIKEEIIKNSSKDWNTWLEVENIFEKQGKQGITGIFKLKDTEKLVFFKISQDINYLIDHESIILNSIQAITSYCPHFPRFYGEIEVLVDPFKTKKENVFEYTSKYKIKKNALLMEFYNKSYKLYNHIVSKKISENVLYSSIKQVLSALEIAQKKINFTHYDLHSNNILMKKCSKNLVFLFKFGKRISCIPTHGYYPIIIDKGFAYSDGMIGNYLCSTLAHTDVGFTSDRFDSITDAKLFLITISDEIHKERQSNNSKKLKNMVKNIFYKLDLDWDSGWDKNQKCCVDKVIKEMKKINNNSEVFKDCDYQIIDILQSLIIHPLKNKKKNNLTLSYNTFIREFIKIENIISSPFFCIYILKCIVDTAKIIKSDYISEKNRHDAVKYFKYEILYCIDSISSFSITKDINFERLLCSLYCLGDDIESILYEEMEKISKIKKDMYSMLKVKKLKNILKIIEANIEDDYVFSEKTTFLCIDYDKEEKYPVISDKNLIDKLNENKSIYWGEIISESLYSESINSSGHSGRSESEKKDFFLNTSPVI